MGEEVHRNLQRFVAERPLSKSNLTATEESLKGNAMKSKMQSESSSESLSKHFWPEWHPLRRCRKAPHVHLAKRGRAWWWKKNHRQFWTPTQTTENLQNFAFLSARLGKLEVPLSEAPKPDSGGRTLWYVFPPKSHDTSWPPFAVSQVWDHSRAQPLLPVYILEVVQGLLCWADAAKTSQVSKESLDRLLLVAPCSRLYRWPAWDVLSL